MKPQVSSKKDSRRCLGEAMTSGLTALVGICMRLAQTRDDVWEKVPPVSLVEFGLACFSKVI